VRFLLALLVLAAGAASAQDYPTRAIRLLTPAAPGGTTDLLARLFGAKLSEAFGQQVIVDNRASASGVVAGDITAKAPPDGYTLLLAYHQHTVNGAMGATLPYHPVNDFTPITQLTAAGFLLLVNPASPPHTLQEFVAWTKSFQRPLNYGSAGLGTGGHLAGELYKQMTGIQAQHIPYKGTGPALIDLIGGRYEFNFSGLQGALVQVRSGKLRALAVTTPKRLAALAELPSVAEALPGFEVVGWYGVIGPGAMPPNIVARLHDELVKALEAPDIRSRILDDGSEPVGSSPADFRAFMSADLDKWGRLVKQSGAKSD